MQIKNYFKLPIYFLWWSVAIAAHSEPAITFSAHTMQCVKKSSEYICTYLGEAQLTQGKNELSGPKIVTYQNAQHEIYQIIASGDPARYHTQDDQRIVDAKAQTIKLYPLKDFVLFIEQAEIIENGTKFDGPYIEYNIKKKTITSKPNTKMQTTIIIPQA